VVWAEISQHKYQKLRFRVFQKQQRMYHTIAQELCGDEKPSDCIVLWGNGSFGPTLKGHASAPNKKLRQKLGLDERLVDEYNTSKSTACCFSKSSYSRQRQVHPPIIGPLPGPHKLHGLLYCSQCTSHDSPFSRDLSHHHAHGVTSNEVAATRVAMAIDQDTTPIKRRSTPWSRDVCSAINIFHRAYFGSRGVLPLCFVRPSRDDEVDGAAA
jgi:hypothetical protein